ncbi:hypothetical protein [Streptomyces cinerochromogenes]|nr:hypothetical protein [Streptomyces cinerochromogenes]GGS99993.1 hypothetical protein GCM10010206_73340 [Streptomyces cinerochromogenes]
MQSNRRRSLGALVGGLIAAVLAFGAVATVAAVDHPGSTHSTAGVFPPSW